MIAMTREMTGLDLRQGAWYALEQSGRLLESAALLFDRGDTATAVGLAMFAAEEMGRSQILRDLAKRSDSGDKIHPDNVRKLCEDHATKQELGRGSISINTDRDTGLGKLMTKYQNSPVGTKEWRDAKQELDMATDAKRKRLPDDRHSLRMSAFYVDVKDSGEWNRPNTLNRKEARKHINDVTNDYAVLLSNLEIGSAQSDSAEMLKALETMNPRPSLALPRWPT
jgi:AbiV family abortive infection protein